MVCVFRLERGPNYNRQTGEVKSVENFTEQFRSMNSRLAGSKQWKSISIEHQRQEKSSGRRTRWRRGWTGLRRGQKWEIILENKCWRVRHEAQTARDSACLLFKYRRQQGTEVGWWPWQSDRWTGLSWLWQSTVLNWHLDLNFPEFHF